VNREAAEAEGARWVAENADVLLIIADRQALSGPNMGSARGGLQLIARRVSAERRGRPVALVWTKADVEVAPEMEAAVREAVVSLMPDALEVQVSVAPDMDGDKSVGLGFIELLDWILTTRRGPVALPAPAANGTDPLFVFGAR
jgi:hypothetical protein